MYDVSKVLSSAIETTNVYGITKYGVHLPVAITRSNRMDGRMLSTMTSTMALLRAPDKVVGRLHYDYQVSSLEMRDYIGGLPALLRDCILSLHTMERPFKRSHVCACIVLA